MNTASGQNTEFFLTLKQEVNTSTMGYALGTLADIYK